MAALTASPAGALSAEEQAYVDHINQARAAVGAGPLAVDGNMTDLARQHTQEMANAQSLYHTASLPAGVTSNWMKLGENVGMGPSVEPVWAAFIASPHHYANIVDP